MTETEIICRTQAQPETPPSPFEVKITQFVDLPGKKLPETKKGTPDKFFRHELDAVQTWQECKELCATDVSCLGFNFKPIIEGVKGWNGCDLTSYTGNSVEGEAEWLEGVEEQEEGTYSAYIPHASRMPKINVEFTQNSVHWRPNMYIEQEYLTGVITQFMPGSVTATAHAVPQVVVTTNG